MFKLPVKNIYIYLAFKRGVEWDGKKCGTNAFFFFHHETHCTLYHTCYHTPRHKDKIDVEIKDKIDVEIKDKIDVESKKLGIR